ncbi:MAG: hypothetical protein QOJ35_2361 [Solirubrobacteraceae bacterium]|nr:hypothetical protein [Solirubrobacteraceae bacterium]
MRLFSPEHLAAIAATALAAALATVLARRLAGGAANTAIEQRRAVALTRALALLILAGFAVEQVTYAARGTWSARVNLPLQLSDAVTLVAIAALWRPRVGLQTELVYFWALSASLQAVLTPDLGETFPDVLFFTYFVTHAGAIVAACVLVFGLRKAPRTGAVLRVYGVTAAFALLAALGCVATGGNYMFLRSKPATGSALDALGPWPVYIVGAAALGLAMLLVLDALARVVARHDAVRR